MLTKSRFIEICSRYNLKPLKRLGQNYLIDGNIKDKIIKEARPEKADHILEIGPGLGALTMDLAMSGASVYAVEKDKRACLALKDIAKDDFPNLKLFCGDILKFDLKVIPAQAKIKVVGNLPFYITTPIIEYLIENRALVKSILITLQREVANRLLASPGTKDYGSISCYVQYYTRPAYIYTIKRNAFYPRPEVDSSLIRLDPLEEPSVEVSDEKLFFKIIRGAFNQRRKAIINSLSHLKEELGFSKEMLSSILKDAGVDPSSRPEELSLSQFARIANTTKPHPGGGVS